MPYLMSTLALVLLFMCGCAGAPNSYPDADVRIDHMQETVRFLTTLQPARSHTHPDAMDKAADYISRKMILYGLAPRPQNVPANGRRYVNVVAGVGPREGRRLVVGAHYDVYGENPGADDNASAIAALLEIARFAKSHEDQLAYGVDFVAYALEEQPFYGTPQMGSYVHAESLQKQNIPVRGMICLEMIGFFSEAPESQSYPLSALRLSYPKTGNFIGVVGNVRSASLVKEVARHMAATQLEVQTLRDRVFSAGVGKSDHRNYWRFGYEAVLITDTGNYRNPNYHQPSDTMETLDFDKMQEVVKGVCWTLLKIR